MFYSIIIVDGPDNVELAPVITVINVTKGTDLGPINCTANCNPECKYQWKHNRTGQFERVQQNFMSNNNRILTIAKVNRSHTGVFRCRVDHKSAKQTKKLTTDLTVNVQCKYLLSKNKLLAALNGKMLRI